MINLYGIPNCATVKKARAWLSENKIDHTFHDFKKSAPTPEQLRAWLQHVPLETLINKRGTTWRKLTPEQQAQAEQTDTAIALMCEHASVIKRPVLVWENQVVVGFNEAMYAEVLGKSR